MSYIDASYNRKNDRMRMAERINGQRVLSEVPVEHVFYYTHPAGSHRTIFDQPCKKFSTYSSKKAEAKKRELLEQPKPPTIVESDIRPEFRHLAKHYTGVDAPVLHLGFFDIEADFHPEKGWSSAEDAENAVTAISLYLSAEETLYTMALCPPTYSSDEACAIGDQFENTMVFDSEIEMLNRFLDLIEDVDVLSGWNSEGYDIPYLVNRVKRLMGEDETRRFCLWGMKPREREYIKFGKTSLTYDLVGRVHLDYLVLYQKHNPQQQQSYRLDYIGEQEVGDNKTPYEGTLDDLYKKEFYRFLEYNRQDVNLLVKIDALKKYIELSNQIAHSNCVLLKTTVGSVALVEAAIINEMHALGYVVPDRKPRDDDQPKKPVRKNILSAEWQDAPEGEDEGRTPVVGAYVAQPKKGIHSEIACIDINSLYPSCIRSLNMSPETITGQVRPTRTMALVHKRIEDGTPRAEAWDGIFCLLEITDMLEQTDAMLEIDFEDGSFIEMTGAEFYDFIFDPQNQLCVSANGTIFRTDKEGIIPQLLAKWYSERQSMQFKQRTYSEAADGLEIDDELAGLLT